MSLLPKGEIMVKRVSILFNTNLRKQLERDPELGKSRGMTEVMRAIHEFLRIAATGHASAPYTVENRVRNVPMKFFSVGYAESKMLAEALRHGARAEIIVSKAQTGVPSIVGNFTMYFAIYTRAKGGCLGDINLAFREDGACVREFGGFRSLY